MSPDNKDCISTNKKSTVSFRVSSQVLTCSEITKILEWDPTEQIDKGVPYSPLEPKNIRKESLWIYDSGWSESMCIEELLERMIKQVLDKKCAIRLLKDCYKDILCGYSTNNGQGGVLVEGRLMKELGDLGIDLEIAFYG